MSVCIERFGKFKEVGEGWIEGRKVIGVVVNFYRVVCLLFMVFVSVFISKERFFLVCYREDCDLGTVIRFGGM